MEGGDVGVVACEGEEDANERRCMYIYVSIGTRR